MPLPPIFIVDNIYADYVRASPRHREAPRQHYAISDLYARILPRDIAPYRRKRLLFLARVALSFATRLPCAFHADDFRLRRYRQPLLRYMMPFFASLTLRLMMPPDASARHAIRHADAYAFITIYLSIISRLISSSA